MKNFDTLLNELNKYEKETVKQARQIFLKDLNIIKMLVDDPTIGEWNLQG